jgi:hypothetical protein
MAGMLTFHAMAEHRDVPPKDICVFCMPEIADKKEGRTEVRPDALG